VRALFVIVLMVGCASVSSVGGRNVLAHPVRGIGMKRSLLSAAAAALALGFLASPPTAHADGRCLFQGDWNCYGTPQYNGPGLNTWDVPGTYGGWTELPEMCPPGADLQPCQQYIPRP
jgi:hypothetical protein